jgi:branched-chain amino acid transport system substrate-binding protein
MKSKLPSVAPMLAPIAAAFALIAVPAQAQMSDNVVRVGVMADMTGPYSGNGGPGSVIAARMAVEDFGGKVNGVPIEVVVADDQNKPDVGLNLARKWIESDKVDAIIGGSASSIALGIQTLMKEKQKPYLLAGTLTSDLTGKSCSPMSIQFLADTYAEPKAMVHTLLEQGVKTFFFVTVDYAFGQAIQAEATRFIEAGGGKVVGSSTRWAPRISRRTWCRRRAATPRRSW